MTEATGDTIANIDLFAGLDADMAAAQSRRCSWMNHEPNELVIDYDDDTCDVRFILSGTVRIVLRIATGREVILTEMGGGEYFGELAALDGQGRSANVTALTRTRVCVMPQPVFLNLIDSEPTINRRVMLMLAQRIRQLNERVSEHCFLQTKHRLYIELLRQSKPRAVNPAHRAISPPPVQRDLAARIGTRREVVSREIARLKREKIVETTTGALVLTDIASLNRLIHKGWEEAG